MKAIFSSDRGRTALRLTAETDRERALLSDLFMPTRIEQKQRIKVRFTNLHNTPRKKDEIIGADIEQVEYITPIKLQQLGFKHLETIAKPNLEECDVNEIELKKQYYRKGSFVVTGDGVCFLYKNVQDVFYWGIDRMINFVSLPRTVIRRVKIRTMAELERELKK